MPPQTSVEIFDALHELLRSLRTPMRQRLEATCPDLSFGELRVMMHVGKDPGCTQKTLVEHSHTDKAQMARTLAQLEGKGWLLRSESAQDRRMRELRLSPRGQRLFQRLATQRATLAAELLENIPAPLQAQLLALLTQARDGVARPAPH